MNFSDLLDEDGQGSRELDAWLAENIAGEDVEWDDCWECYKTDDVIVTEAHPVYVKPFTTGDSIDPIWELAKEYFSDNVLKLESNKHSNFEEHFVSIQQKGVVTEIRKTEQLAIAETLFKAYQKENAISTEEAVEKYDDPENLFPPEGDE